MFEEFIEMKVIPGLSCSLQKVLDYSFVTPVCYLNLTYYFHSSPSHFTSEREVENAKCYSVERDV